jgi:hypothetical protein
VLKIALLTDDSTKRWADLSKSAVDVPPSIPNRIASPAFRIHNTPDPEYPLTGKNSLPILPRIESDILSKTAAVQ